MRYTLKELHSRKGKKHQEVARRVGLSRAYYTQILLGRSVPSLRTARRIARYFNVSLDDIIFPAEVGKTNKAGRENEQ